VRCRIGIDPGMNGALVALVDKGPVIVSKMPLAGSEIDARAVATWLADLTMRSDDVVAVVERVHSMPKQGIASTFKFGTGWGMIRGVLAALGVRTELVPPQTWKAGILQGTLKDKQAAIAWCRSSYPNVQLILPGCRGPHDGIADALCMADYCDRNFR
jgi:crossover junction endodeoxyribonuclease RuvC